MKDIVREYQEQFRHRRLQLRRYTALLLALAMVTTLFVNWQLHSDGIAITADYKCGEVEHTHTADCYEKVLVCGYEEGEPEDGSAAVPDDSTSIDESFGVDAADDYGISTYSAEPEYIFVPHEHTEECYQEVQTLTCFEEEHEHTDDCFDPEDGSLICDKFEHTHDESCYTTEYELVCGLEEGELVEELNPDYNPVAMFEEPVAAKPVVVEPVVEAPVHHHTDDCYEEVLVCGLPEHHHTVNCLADPYDDIEDEAEWLSKTDTSLDGLWTDDLLTVAKSQLGYEQSEKNFKLDTDDGVTVRHYTRYGQWYGNPYGAWDVMFLSYCLNYANIPQSAVPQRAGTLALRSELRGSEYMGDFAGDMPIDAVMPGDIVFYQTTTTETVAVDNEQPQVMDDSPDADVALLSMDTAESEPQTEERTVTTETVGIVSDVDYDAGTLTVISGDVDGKVAEVPLTASQVTALVSVASAQAGDDGAAEQPDSDSSKSTVTYIDYFDETSTDKRGGITSATVSINNNPVTGNITLTDGDEITLKYGYYIPEDVLDPEHGQNKLTYRLPDGLVPSKKTTVELEGGVGTLTIDKDGTVTLEFNDSFNRDKPFSGTFEFKAKVKTDDVGDGGQITIPGDSTTITVNNPRGIGISKSGTFDESNGKQVIHYTVTVSSKEGWNELVKIGDKLDTSQNITGKYLWDTIKLVDKNGNDVVDKNGNKIDVSKLLTKDEDGNGFLIEGLPEMKKGDKYVLTYDVEVTGNKNANGSGSFHNYAWTNNDQKTDPWTWHGEYIKKEGSYNADDGYMYWKVTLPNYYGGNLKGFKLSDVLQDSGATIVGDVTITETSQNYQQSVFDTIKADGKSNFDYTFTKDAVGREYTFTYKTKVPEGVTNVQNKSNVTTPGGGKYDADTGVNVTDRSWGPYKSTSGSLTEVDGKLIAPWKFETPVPNSWKDYTITDSFKDIGDNADHYGIASELQSQIEEKLTFTLVDGTTLSYAQAKAAGISIDIKYYDNVDPKKSAANEVSAANSTTKVRSFVITLNKGTYSGANVKTLTLDGYTTYVDISKLEPGDSIEIHNKANGKEAKWTYSKPKQTYDFEKGVAMEAPVQLHYAGHYSDKVTIEYNNNGDTYIYYQLIMRISDWAALAKQDTLTVTDTLPEGLIFDATDADSYQGTFVKIDNSSYWYSYSRDWNRYQQDGIQYYDLLNHKDRFLKVSQDGQKITFTFVDLSSIDTREYYQLGGLVVRYRVKVDPEKWKNWVGDGVDDNDTDERTYTNKAQWGDNETSADATVIRKVDNLDKSAQQLKDAYGNKIGSVGYTLKINSGAKDLIPNSDTVTLTDTLTVKKGFSAELDLNSVLLYDAADTTFSNPLPRTLYQFQYEVSEDASGQNVYIMTLTIPDSRALVLKYNYATNAGVGQEVELKNEAKLGAKWDADKSTTLRDIQARGDISQGKLVVHKVDSLNQSLGLEGAKFSLYWLDSNGNWESSAKQAFESDSHGVFTIYVGHEELNVQPNILYKLVEDSAPGGYRKSEKDYYFVWTTDDASNPQTPQQAYDAALKGRVVDADGNELPSMKNVLICIGGQQSDLYVSNERSQLTIQKFWTNIYNENITPTETTSVTVRLYRYAIDGGSRDAAEMVEDIPLTADNHWTATYTNVEPGYRYFIEELNTGKKYEVIYSDSNTAGVENGGLLTLTNKETPAGSYELPSTGGAGTTLYTAVGGAMALAALVCGVCQKRRRERRAH